LPNLQQRNLRALKIAVLIDRLNVGGVEKVAMEEVRALNEIGHHAELVVLRRRGLVDNPFPDLQRRIVVSYLDDRLPRILTGSLPLRPFYFLSLFHFTYPLFLPWVVRQREYDLMISHNSYTSLTALALSWLKSIPYVMYVWDPSASIASRIYVRGVLGKIRFVTVRLAKMLDKLLAGSALAVVTSSEIHGKFLRQITQPSKVRLVPPGRKPSAALPVSRGSFLVTVTAWKEGKRLEDLLRVIAELDQGDLKVVGRWIHEDYRQTINQLIATIGLTDRVEITGEVTESELDELYGAARAVVIASEEQGFGLAALEGAATGCPFIMPDVCGAAGFFEDGVDGMLFPLGDSARLRECLSRMLSDERLAYRMGHHGRELVINRYTWANHVRSLLELAG
jgi:glycosyltransferase involved in cell wall biosynthesis